MPELPEVETVRRILEEKLVGKTFGKPAVLVKKAVQTPLRDFEEGIDGARVQKVARRGKYLLLHLSGERKVLFHLRMEGKLFVVDGKRLEQRHLTLSIPLKGEDKVLAFYDVRKFGVVYLLNEREDGPLSRLGPEPVDAVDPRWLQKRLSRTSKAIKECLMDQTVLSGIGNIYADEILFAAAVSPFRPAKTVTLSQCEKILAEAKRILSLAIENNGSTIRSYKASESVHGDMQNFLQVYQREGTLCPRCHRFRIERGVLGGRGTHYCPHCQNTGYSLGVTGKIGSGKSLACLYFRKLGYASFSCDEEVHRLYADEAFLRQLRKKYPFLFDPDLDKAKLTDALLKDRRFHRAYETFLFAKLRERIEAFLAKNDGRDKVVEVPLLFDAHYEKLFTFLVGTQTTKQRAHLKERGDKDIQKRLAFNALNSYDKNVGKLDFVIQTDYSKRHLQEEVKRIDAAIHRKDWKTSAA